MVPALLKIQTPRLYPVLRRMRTELRTRASVQDGIKHFESDGCSSVLDYQPGNGTRYTLLISTIPGNGGRKVLGCEPGSRLAYVQNYGKAVLLPPGVPVQHEEVRKTLGCSAVDAVVLAEVLGTLLGEEHVSCDDYLQERGLA